MTIVVIAVLIAAGFLAALRHFVPEYYGALIRWTRSGVADLLRALATRIDVKS